MRTQGTPAGPPESGDAAPARHAARRPLPWRRGGRSDLPTSQASTRPIKATVAAVFDDEVRAEQSAAAIQVWARAHRELGVGPVAVLARDASGGTTYRPQHVTSPRWGALTGLLVGLILLGLPAAGAAGLAVWALGSVIFGVFGLIGVIPSAEVGSVTVAATAVGSALAALLVGAVGGLLGALVGLLWGLLVHHLRGFGRSDVARALAMLQPGSAATIVRVATPSSPLVDRELARLGGVTAVGSGTPV